MCVCGGIGVLLLKSGDGIEPTNSISFVLFNPNKLFLITCICLFVNSNDVTSKSGKNPKNHQEYLSDLKNQCHLE